MEELRDGRTCAATLFSKPDSSPCDAASASRARCFSPSTRSSAISCAASRA